MGKGNPTLPVPTCVCPGACGANILHWFTWEGDEHDLNLGGFSIIKKVSATRNRLFFSFCCYACVSFLSPLLPQINSARFSLLLTLKLEYQTVARLFSNVLWRNLSLWHHTVSKHACLMELQIQWLKPPCTQWSTERPPASTWVAGSLPWAGRRESLSSSTSSLRRLWTWRERSRSHSSTGREDRAWRPERMLVENAVDCLSDGCSALFILWISHPNASGCTLHIQYNTAFLTILKRCRICPNMRVRYPPNVVLNERCYVDTFKKFAFPSQWISS